MSTKRTCAKCGLEKKCSLEPTLNALIMGGFKADLEYRCKDCEKKIVQTIRKMVSKPGGFSRR